MVASIALPLVWALSATGTTVVLSRRSFGKSAAATFCLAGLMLYLSGLAFNTFAPGFVAACGYALAFPVLVVVGMVARPRLVEGLRGNYLSFPLLLFVCIYALVCVFDLHRAFAYWDEFSHWGPMVKEMVRLDAFYNAVGSGLSVHQDYPPFVSLFQLLFCDLSGGGYAEPVLYRSLHVFCFSLLLYPVQDVSSAPLKVPNKIGAVIVLICALAVMVPFSTSIYIDPFVATLGGVLVYIALTERLSDGYAVFSLGLFASALLLSKQIGLVFVLLAWFAVILRLMISGDTRDEVARRGVLRNLLSAAIVVALPLALMLSWQLYCANLGIEGQFSVSQILATLMSGTVSAESVSIVQSFLRALLATSVIGGSAPVSFVAALAALVVAYCVMSWALRRFARVRECPNGVVVAVIIVGALGYALVLLVLYAFGGFSLAEARQLASYDRYMLTYLLCIGILCYCVLMRSVCAIEVAESGRATVALGASACLLGAAVVVLASRFAPAALVDSGMPELQAEAISIAERTGGEGKVFVVSEDPHVNVKMDYYLCPQPTNLWYVYRFGGATTGGASTEYSLEQFADAMRQYDYLYLHVDDPYIAEHYAALFDSDATFGAGDLYSVSLDGDGELRLSKV